MQREQINQGQVYRPPIRWVSVENQETVAVPPFGVMEIVEMDTTKDSQGNVSGALKIKMPTADSIPAAGLVINGEIAIPAKDANGKAGQGQGIMSYPTAAAYEPDNATPTIRDTWGTKAGSFWLAAGKTGFAYCGGARGGVMNVMPEDAGAGFWAVITGVSPYDDDRDTGVVYSWENTTQTEGEFDLVLPSGSKNAFEVNLNPGVSPGTIVRLYPGPDGFFYFEHYDEEEEETVINGGVDIPLAFAQRYLVLGATSVVLPNIFVNGVPNPNIHAQYQWLRIRMATTDNPDVASLMTIKNPYGSVFRYMLPGESALLVLRPGDFVFEKASGVSRPMMSSMLGGGVGLPAVTAATKVPVGSNDVSLPLETFGHMGDTANYRINIYRSGLYNVSARVAAQYYGGASGVCTATIYLNGFAAIFIVASAYISNGSINYINLTGVLSLQKGDYVELWASSTVAVGIDAGGAYPSQLTVEEANPW